PRSVTLQAACGPRNNSPRAHRSDCSQFPKSQRVWASAFETITAHAQRTRYGPTAARPSNEYFRPFSDVAIARWLPLRSNTADTDRTAGRCQPNVSIYGKLPPTEAVTRPPAPIRGVAPMTESSHAVSLGHVSQ